MISSQDELNSTICRDAIYNSHGILDLISKQKSPHFYSKSSEQNLSSTAIKPYFKQNKIRRNGHMASLTLNSSNLQPLLHYSTESSHKSDLGSLTMNSKSL